MKPSLQAALAVALHTRPSADSLQCLITSYGYPCPPLEVRAFGGAAVVVERGSGDSLDVVLARLGVGRG